MAVKVHFVTAVSQWWMFKGKALINDSCSLDSTDGDFVPPSRQLHTYGKYLTRHIYYASLVKYSYKLSIWILA